MGERGSRKIPVTDRQFLWVQDDDKGEVILHVGPTMVSPTAADRVVVDDGRGGFQEDNTGQPQRMVELSDSQYAVLYNPLADRLEDEGSNGRFRPGRNESRPLKNGTRHMIPGPCSFFLRPGQRIEVRDVHELASNQYLVVKVYGGVDRTALYSDITARSAAITTATAEEVPEESTSLHVEDVHPVESLTRGQLIVIRGLDTQFYIPPTGVDVVPDLSVNAEGKAITAATARRLLMSMPATLAPMAPSRPSPADELLVQTLEEAVDDDGFQQEAPAKPKKSSARFRKMDQDRVEQSARLRQAVSKAQPPEVEPEPQESALSQDEIQSLLSSEVHRQALEREIRKSRLVRQAVVLSEKEFCVILDADGKRQIKVGPARVFPGPYDSFMVRGSANRIYDAYELLPQRALWLRFILPISREKLSQRVPRSVELTQETYYPGDELILSGVNSFFFPFNEIEILHPLTGQPHVGNDHSDVFIESIGIDQKSGIYVRDLATGEARLVRGKQSYLVDPRKEVHITRTVPVDQWNLWIAASEPHKATSRAITTPWAISITVPHNTAVLATSAGGQRVIQGPRVELLEYEESLVVLSLSTGTPKSDSRLLKTCFLRTVGNQISDVIRIKTADFVQVDIKVSYRVTFDAEFQELWFNHENYVGVLCDHLRSIVRSRCRQMSLTELWPQVSTVLRDTILGERTDQGRKGRLFEENGMRVTEVEVLESEILDEDIAELLEKVQRESVSLVIGDQQASEQLRSDQHRHLIAQQRMEIERELAELQATLQGARRGFEHQTLLEKLKNAKALSREEVLLDAERLILEQDDKQKRLRMGTEGEAERMAIETHARVEAQKKLHAEEQEYRSALHALELAGIQARSAATVAEREAIQPALVEALTALGDKFLLGQAAENMNLVSLFKGKDIGTLFQDILGGTPLGRTIDQLLPEQPSGNPKKPK